MDSLSSISKLIAQTPLLAITLKEAKREECTIYAKYETMSLSGSIKDRMVYYILKEAYASGSLEAGQGIVEVTSGNTGIALAAMAAMLGHPLSIVMPDFLSQERYSALILHGVELIKVSKEEGGFLQSLELAKIISKGRGYFYPDQFSNLNNPKAHRETTAVEIVEQLARIGLKPQHFVAGMGTGGTIMGCLAGFKELGVSCSCYPLEPANSPILTNGVKTVGKHRIQGIVDDFIPAIMDLSKLDKIISIDDGEAIAMSQKICSRGLSVGISSGANLLGAYQLALEKPQETVVTVLPDNALRYLSTDLSKDITRNKEYMQSGSIELTKIETII